MQSKNLEHFDLWLSGENIKLVTQLHAELRKADAAGAECTTRAAIDKKMERLAAAMNLLDEYRASDL